MQKTFMTIKENRTAEIVEKRSKFIANIFHVKNEDEANLKIAEVKKNNRDARHNVYAYRLDNGVERYSDDGEPSGTAGVPILDILRGEKLFNVLVVVTRYFGGILLGTGGLVRCYGGVAKNAIENSAKIEMKLCNEYKIVVDYDSYSNIQYYCNNNNIIILETKFIEKIVINVLITNSEKEKFLHDLSEITNRTAVCEAVGEYYHE